MPKSGSTTQVISHWRPTANKLPQRFNSSCVVCLGRPTSHDSERITEHINDEHQPQRTRDRNDEQKACPWSQLALPGLLRRGPMVHLPVRNAAGSQIVLAVPVVYLSTGVPR